MSFGSDFPVFYVDSEKPFKQLNTIDKLYCYYISKVSWAGAAFMFNERCYDGISLSYLFSKIFALESPSTLSLKWCT